MPQIAITREVSPAIGACELTHVARTPIDVDLARAQHHRYEVLLSEAGFAVLRLPAAPDLPDSIFVEDGALAFDEVAVLTRPGAPSRRAEVEALGAALAPYRPLASLVAPATLDGGDVLVIGRTVHVGLTARTNREGIDQLRAILAPHGYRVEGAEVRGCLHLKSAVTPAGPGRLLVNPRWVEKGRFGAHETIEVDPSEPFAANALWTGRYLIHPVAFPRTRERLETAGVRVAAVDVSEIQKAEGGVTCCSILLGGETMPR